MIAAFRDLNPYWQWMGFSIEEYLAKQGRAVVKVAVRPEFLQHQGLIHGGVLSALIDSAGAWGFGITHGESLRTINLAVQYLMPCVAETKELQAEASMVRVGRRIVVAEVTVSGWSNDIVAQGQVIYSRARSPMSPHS